MKNKMLTKKDICIIIATYNRPDDIDKTLSCLIKNRNIPGKIIIVDQSKDEKTKQVVGKYSKKLPLEYLYCKVPSADISMNMGIKKARKKFRLILTAGDDVDFLGNYLEEMLKEFNIHPEVMAVGGADLPQEYKLNSLKNRLSNFFLKLFYLPFKEDHKFRITGPYGHTTSPEIKKPIRDAQWVPGFNYCCRSEVYSDYLWPEIRGYNVIDDIDSSYRVYKKYGTGSVVITPKCRVYHRYSHIARYDEKKRIFVNHEDHFSYYYLHFNNFKGSIKIIISLTGILIGNFLRSIVKRNFKIFRYNLEGIAYSFKHRKDIKNKKFRTFLNDDLSMKEI